MVTVRKKTSGLQWKGKVRGEEKKYEREYERKEVGAAGAGVFPGVSSPWNGHHDRQP